MDVDAPRAMGFDAQGDDDLIDYDDDDIQMPGPIWKPSNTATSVNDESLGLEEEVRMDTAGNQTNTSHVATGEEPQQFDRDDNYSEQHILPENNSSLPTPHDNVDTQTHETDLEVLSEHGHVESAYTEHQGGEDAGDPAPRNNQTEEDIHEIDYEDKEETLGGSGDVEQATETVPDEAGGLSVVEMDDDALHQPENRQVDDDAPLPSEPAGEAKEHEEHEITYEEDGEHMAQSFHGKVSSTVGEPVHALPTEATSEQFNDGATAHATADKDELDDGSDNDAADQDQTGANEESAHRNEDDFELQDHSESGPSSQHDVNVPAITVQYKGEEFPFFSLSSDGFFSELSILDGTVGNMLASLRGVLGDEISEEEELVLQIDELGLEYSEVRSPCGFHHLDC